jgi:capsular exopolysaccharide synthesis family protein
VLLAAAVGLAGAVLVVFVLERLDNTLKDVEEVERYLGIPSLGVIPDFLSARDNNVYSLRAGASAARGERQLDYSKEIVLSYGSYSAAGEAYRMLRTAFVLSRAGAPPKTALVTSAVKGDGKTITAVNLAVMLAMTHKKVILVDADLRLPRCHDLFAFDNFFGLTEVLTGAREFREAVRATEIEGLDLLSSGEIPPNPSELLGSERMRAVLAQLEDLYDYVIIDSTPITQTSESTLLSTLVDGVIVVARSDSPKQQVRAALAKLRYARAKILGLVLNKTGDSRTHYQYHYYYGDSQQRSSTGSETAAAG